ncbi:MAG: RHS repeat-associated core domain-containing protein [Candidatus Saccharicenans sp.]|nr:RHS repeat-associated core domain-containing protein [Candidatus Saccharicenans sp.]
MQQTWVNTFNPGWKFSGQEQDAESGLYYFGARYYEPALYRFLSPDPVIPTDRALYNPQRWNLYGYCGGNPISNFEIDGFDYVGCIYIYRLYTRGNVTYGTMFISGKNRCAIGTTQERWPNRIASGEYQAKLS